MKHSTEFQSSLRCLVSLGRITEYRFLFASLDRMLPKVKSKAPCHCFHLLFWTKDSVRGHRAR